MEIEKKFEWMNFKNFKNNFHKNKYIIIVKNIR